MGIELHEGDSLEVLKKFPENSIDSIVTDPPYALTAGKKGGSGVKSIDLNSPHGRSRIGSGNGTGGFMGMKWDEKLPDAEFWKEALRVAKPGAYLLAFGGTRTFHRLACAIEDAGWELRDCIMWCYGSGFPKSLDASKALDKQAGQEREVIAKAKPVKRMIPGADQNKTGSWIKDNGREFVPTITAPATDEAKKWKGWGTALKPAYEPILVGYRPLTAQQFTSLLTEKIRSQLCQFLDASVAKKIFIDTQAKSSEVVRTVPESARIYELENSGNVQFVAKRFTWQSPESNVETENSAPTPAKVNGKPNTAMENEILIGRVDAFLTEFLDTFMLGKTVNISESTVLSWNNISDEILSRANRFTTKTGIKLTIALRTLSCFLSQIISTDIGNSSLNLSPAYEPIIMARKPLDGTVADNLKKWGVGAINIDGCRIPTEDNLNGGAYSGGVRPTAAMGCNGKVGGTNSMLEEGVGRLPPEAFVQPLGRWPANLCHDGSAEVISIFPESKSTGGSGDASMGALGKSKYGKYALDRKGAHIGGLGDCGSAARFFYCAKASKADRGEGNNHPTVKPHELMKYLCRLVTPPNGTVLDPFMGSGSTGKAAIKEGFNFVGIEREPEYVNIARKRILTKDASKVELQETPTEKTPKPEKPLPIEFEE